MTADHTEAELLEDARAAHSLAQEAFYRVRAGGLQLWEPGECAAVANALANTARNLAELERSEGRDEH